MTMNVVAMLALLVQMHVCQALPPVQSPSGDQVQAIVCMMADKPDDTDKTPDQEKPDNDLPRSAPQKKPSHT